MKFRAISALLVGVLLTLGTNLRAQEDLTDASGYMDAINNRYDGVSEDMMSYVSAAAHSRRARKIEKKRKEVMYTMFQAMRMIKRLPDFEGDGTYRDAVVKCLETNYNALNEDYEEIVNMEEVAQESYDAMEAYLKLKEKVDQKIDEAQLALKEAQREFATANDIRLIESSDKLSDKIKASNRVVTYNNEVYLTFFKSYIEEKYLLDAIQAGDLSAMEQRKNALKKFSEEGIVKLREIDGFDGDRSLINACGFLLRFYIDEADNEVPKFEDFYLKKEQFEKIKAAVEAKRSSDRTQEDIDLYNNSLKEYNAMIDVFNNANSATFKKRSGLIDDYNKAQSKFVDKHTPRYK